MKRLAFIVILAVTLMLVTAVPALADGADNDGSYYCHGYFQGSNSSSGYFCH